ncbi:phage virion morphogenesis protein [Vibrio scophthalmi]|uniref:Virion morphogenesis protein n=1 Tax=Vibrio scophthalmi TaxID=45658 RepID=A0A1E3WEV6_9VIBR|nr:phage virion morphogenesis protein [Vibrio scophthalmi]ODS04316.1 hypothetical protein VSF3289_03447 [Vibrio scophthalmi]
MQLSSPDQLTQLVESLVLDASEKYELNRRMANRARQFFRQQIRSQRDVDNNPYQSRRKRNMSIVSRGVRGKHGAKHQRNQVARNTVNNKNMLLGISKSLRTRVSDKDFEVGLVGVAGLIGREHNEGSEVSFTTRVNGYFDSNTGRWRGGVATKRNYTMTQRTFIGWTPELERELMAMAAEHFALEDTA